MTDTTKPIPKSLHTVRVLAIMARMFQRANSGLTNDSAVSCALIELGYVDTPDLHGLKAATLKAMQGNG